MEQILPPEMLLQRVVRFTHRAEVRHTGLPMRMPQEDILRTAAVQHLLVHQQQQAELITVVQLLQQEMFKAEHIRDLAVEIQVEVLHIQGLLVAIAAVQVPQEVLLQHHALQHREEAQLLLTGLIQDQAIRITIRIQVLRIHSLQGRIRHPRTEQLLHREAILLHQTIQLPAEQPVLQGHRVQLIVLRDRQAHQALPDHQDLTAVLHVLQAHHTVVLHVLHQAAVTLLHQEVVPAQVQAHHPVQARPHQEAAVRDQAAEDNQSKYPAYLI